MRNLTIKKIEPVNPPITDMAFIKVNTYLVIVRSSSPSPIPTPDINP